MNDSISIYKIHKLFEKSVRDIISDVHKSRGAPNNCKHIYSNYDSDFMKRYTESEESNIAHMLKGYLQRWFTISSLSMMIYKDFFQRSLLKSVSDEHHYKFMQNSYQGGYTQAFVIG